MQTYTNTRGARIESPELRKMVPSAFSRQASPDVSDKYHFINTGDIIKAMAESGYVPVKADQSMVKVRGNGGNKMFCKHVVRMTHESYLNTRKPTMVGDVIPQILLTNSHDRTSAFHLSAGLFRLVCANGMAVSAAGFASMRILHNDSAILDLVTEGVKSIQELTESTIVPQVEKMTHLQLSAPQEREFALAATVLKYGEVKESEVPLLLNCRREADAARNMWAVMNRIQENAVKGGYETTDSIGRAVTSRGITSAVKDLDFNVKLWNLGARVTAELS